MSVPVSKNRNEGRIHRGAEVEFRQPVDSRENCEFGYNAAGMSNQSNTAEVWPSLPWTVREYRTVTPGSTIISRGGADQNTAVTTQGCGSYTSSLRWVVTYGRVQGD